MDFRGDGGGRVSTSSFRDAIELGTGSLRVDRVRRVLAEAVGTFFLLLAVVGSGIMAQTLSPHDVGLQLLENAAATAGATPRPTAMARQPSGASARATMPSRTRKESANRFSTVVANRSWSSTAATTRRPASPAARSSV